MELSQEIAQKDLWDNTLVNTTCDVFRKLDPAVRSSALSGISYILSESPNIDEVKINCLPTHELDDEFRRAGIFDSHNRLTRPDIIKRILTTPKILSKLGVDIVTEEKMASETPKENDVKHTFELNEVKLEEALSALAEKPAEQTWYDKELASVKQLTNS